MTCRHLKRDQLSNIIHAVLIKNAPHLYYYQGYHDFVSVFLLTLGENLGYYCVEAASRYLIRDYMLEGFEGGVMPLLSLGMKLLQEADPDVYELVAMGGDLPTFFVSWVLTWFSHDLHTFSQVQRIFDACLSSHPLFPLYMAIATILYNKERLEENFDYDDPLTSLYIVYQRISPNSYTFEVEAVIQEAQRVLILCPPETLLKKYRNDIKFKEESPFV